SVPCRWTPVPRFTIGSILAPVLQLPSRAGAVGRGGVPFEPPSLSLIVTPPASTFCFLHLTFPRELIRGFCFEVGTGNAYPHGAGGPGCSDPRTVYHPPAGQARKKRSRPLRNVPALTGRLAPAAPSLQLAVV